jgi:predicted ATPase
MPHHTLNAPEYGVLDAYDVQLKARGFSADPAQRAAVARLQTLYTELLAFKAARRTRLRKMLARPPMPKSVYFWGGVGCGKNLPDGLYPDGLMRVNFLPTIKLFKARFDVLEVDDGTDYRLRTLEQIESWLIPANAEASARLVDDFRRLVGVAPQAGEIEVLERRLPVRGRAEGVVWFDFEALCRTALAERLPRNRPRPPYRAAVGHPRHARRGGVGGAAADLVDRRTLRFSRQTHRQRGGRGWRTLY